ncbi:Ig-like domain-containing protein [Shewanella algae]|uniref:Ig-like domain-containing protein n=1 Tax=Shewanella algae TaxID=38313 RepID=UPI002358D7F4|nr:hypothetical protein [Shewanella algae]MDC8855809.1 hypothetical protein [Shewanella algae]
MKFHLKSKIVLFSFLLLVFLSGCGGGDESTSLGNGHNDGQVENPYDTLKLQDNVNVTSLRGEYKVDLQSSILSHDNSKFILRKVDVLSTRKDCQVLSVEKYGFIISADNSKVCDFRYYIELTETNGNESSEYSAISRVAVSRESEAVSLMPLGLYTLKGTELNIDLDFEFKKYGISLDGFTLSDDILLPYNNNSVVMSEAETRIIKFVPDFSFQGIERILFSLSDAKGNVRIGTIDIAVANEANQGLTVEDKIVYPEQLDIKKDTVIDLSPYVTSHDGDDYQLVYVEAFNANVQPTYPTDLNNKKFTFNASEEGEYIVSFAVSDHNGAYAMGLIALTTSHFGKVFTWQDIVYNNILYTAPLSEVEALKIGVNFEKSVVDTSTVPSVSMAAFTREQLKNYCESINAKIPDTLEMSNMVKNVAISDAYHWPIAPGYITYHPQEGKYYKVNKTGDYNLLYEDGIYAYAVCARKVFFKLDNLASKLVAVANNVDSVTVVAKLFVDKEVVTNKLITASLSEGSSANLLADWGITDKDGLVSLVLTSTKSEKSTLTLKYNKSELVVPIEFIGDIGTARALQTTTINNRPYRGNEVQVELKDHYDNPLSGYDVYFSAIGSTHNVLVNSSGKTDDNGLVKARVDWVGDGLTSPENVKIQSKIPLDDINYPIISNSDVRFGAYMCGTGVNDTSKDFASLKQSCVKVTQYNGALYSSTVAEEFLIGLGYKKDNSHFPSERTYSSSVVGPSGIPVARFSQISGYDQYDYWCNELSRLKVAGKENWRKTTRDELHLLKNAYKEKGKASMLDAFGWPQSGYSWTSTYSPHDGMFYQVPLYQTNAEESKDYETSSKEATCIAF